MDTEKFLLLLQQRKLPAEKYDKIVAIAEKFEAFITARGSLDAPGAEDVFAFSEELISEGLNEFDSYLAVAQYGRFFKNDAVLIACIEIIDGAEAMGNLYERLGTQVGEEVRDQVFAQIDLPVYGTPPADRPVVTKVVMERLERLVAPETCILLLKDSLRDLYTNPDDRQKFLASDGIADFLQKKGDEFIAYLTQLKDSGQLYFNQPITADVIEFVEQNPEIRQGVLQGNVIYETKIPFMAVDYLRETDERMKRYYACHCPWTRESLLSEDGPVSPTFCNCSAGFHKKYWEGVFDQPLRAEVLENVLQGDIRCRFAIYLPEETAQ